MGSSLPNDIAFSNVQMLGLCERLFLTLNWSSWWPLALYGSTNTSASLSGDNTNAPPPVCSSLGSSPQMLSCLKSLHHSSAARYRTSTQVNKTITSHEGKKMVRILGNLWGRWRSKGSLSKDLIFELSPRECAGARRTRGRAFQTEEYSLN